MAYAALLAALTRDAAPRAPQETLRLRWPVASDVVSALQEPLAAGVTDLACFLPLGLLTALGMGRRAGRIQRTFRVWLPGLAISGALSAAVVGFGYRPWARPGMLDLALPAAGCVMGVWTGVSWMKGWRARWWLLPKLALLTVGLAVALAGLLVLGLERSPSGFEPARLESEDRRRLYRLFKENHPAKLTQGQTAELRLSEIDLDHLLAWGLTPAWPGAKAKVELGRDSSRLEVSLPLPAAGIDRYLNLTALGEFKIDEGRPRLRAQRLSLGRIEIPSWALDPLSRLLTLFLRSEPRLRPLLAPIHNFEPEHGALRIRYGRAEPKGFLADLFQGEGTSDADIPALRAQFARLTQAAPSLPRDGEARLARSLEAAFRLARERSLPGDAVRENRAAILALGVLLGHWRVESLLGQGVHGPSLRQAARSFRGSTLRGREDWTRHFFVSAALAVLATGSVSDAAGLLKEEVDSAGGSGFSFGDLLADRAGATFAEWATRDQATALALQQRVARGFRIGDYFPDATGLPEGLQETELRARYGGVGGEGYRRLAQEIERRIRSCAAYHLDAPAPPRGL